MGLDALKNKVSLVQTLGNLLVWESCSYRNRNRWKAWLTQSPGLPRECLGKAAPGKPLSGLRRVRVSEMGCGRLGKVPKKPYDSFTSADAPAPGGLRGTLILLPNWGGTYYSTSVVAISVFPLAADEGNRNFWFAVTGSPVLHPSECCNLNMRNRCFVVVNVNSLPLPVD